MIKKAKPVRYQLCIVASFPKGSLPCLRFICGRLGPAPEKLPWQATFACDFSGSPTVPRIVSAFLLPSLVAKIVGGESRAIATYDQLDFGFDSDEISSTRLPGFFHKIRNVINSLNSQEGAFRRSPPVSSESSSNTNEAQLSGYARYRFLCPADQLTHFPATNSGVIRSSFPRSNQGMTFNISRPFLADDVLVCNFDVLANHFHTMDMKQIAHHLPRNLERLREWNALLDVDVRGGFGLLCKCAMAFAFHGEQSLIKPGHVSRLRSAIMRKAALIAGRPRSSHHDLQHIHKNKLKDFADHYLKDPIPFCGRKKQIETLNRWVNSRHSNPYFLLTANAGMGKSALLQQWLQSLPKNSKQTVLCWPISLWLGTNKGYQLLHYLATSLCNVHKKTPPRRDDRECMLADIVAECVAIPMPKGHRLLLVIDGLDELQPITAIAGIFPHLLPPGTKVLLSARLMADHTHQDWLNELGLVDTADAPHGVSLDALTKDNVAEIVSRLNIRQLTREKTHSIAQSLHSLSKGDPFLLNLYAKDMLEHAKKGTIRSWAESLHAMTPGLRKYFSAWWADQAKLAGTQFNARATEDILILLACAGGPILRSELQHILTNKKQVLSGPEIAKIIKCVSRFITGDARIRGYSLCHPLFADFIRNEWLFSTTDVFNCHNRFIETSSLLMNHHSALPQASTMSKSNYFTRNIRHHVDACGWQAKHAELITSSSWRQFGEVGEPPVFALDDLQQLLAIMREKNQARLAQNPPDTSLLASEIQAILHRSTLFTRHMRMSGFLLYQFVYWNIWPIEIALRYVRQVPFPSERLMMLSRILPLARHENSEYAKSIIRDIRLIVSEDPDAEYNRDPLSEAGCFLAYHGYISEGLGLLATTDTSTSIMSRQSCLNGIAEMVAQHAPHMVISLSGEISNPIIMKEFWLCMLSHLPHNSFDATQVLARISEVVDASGDASKACSLLIMLANSCACEVLHNTLLNQARLHLSDVSSSNRASLESDIARAYPCTKSRHFNPMAWAFSEICHDFAHAPKLRDQLYELATYDFHPVPQIVLRDLAARPSEDMRRQQTVNALLTKALESVIPIGDHDICNDAVTALESASSDRDSSSALESSDPSSESTKVAPDKSHIHANCQDVASVLEHLADTPIDQADYAWSKVNEMVQAGAWDRAMSVVTHVRHRFLRATILVSMAPFAETAQQMAETVRKVLHCITFGPKLPYIEDFVFFHKPPLILCELPIEELHSLLSDLLDGVAALGRLHVIRNLRHLGPVFERIGGAALVQKIAHAIRTESECWP